VVLLQVFTILASRGDVYVLGEAYAFGVIWSFTFNSLAMLVLRFKYKGERGWKVPPNITIAGHEIPIGLASVFLVLLSTALVNLATKSVATVAGVSFSVVFFVIFTASERVNQKKYAIAKQQMKDHFQLLQRDTVERESLRIRRGNVLVPVRDYNTLTHLHWALERIDTREQDVVVMSARISRFGAAAYDLAPEQIFSDYEQTLFTRAVNVAESFGKKVSLLVVPAADVWAAIVQTANNLESSAVVLGISSKMTPQEQAFNLGRAWEALAEPKRQFVLQVVPPNGHVVTFRIGPHSPTMKDEDVLLLHRLWLNITREPGLDKLHHHEILREALTRFAHDYGARDREQILKDLRRASLQTASDRNTSLDESGPVVQKESDDGPRTEPAP
jgi:Amino acid permease